MTAAVESALAILPLRAETKRHEQLRRAAGAQISELMQARNEAIWHLFHDHHMSAHEIADGLKAALVERGLSDAELKRAGISHDTVQSIAGRRSTPTPPPSQP